MPVANKRHYRVVQKDKEENGTSQTCLSQDCMTRATIVGVIVYTTSVILAMSVGYLIGKHE